MSADRKTAVYALLDALGIDYGVVEHPPLFSQADSERHKVDIGAAIFKNLFLRNADKSQYYLLSLPLAKRADLNKVRAVLDESRLSFGDEAELLGKLNISPGSVSLLNIVGKPDTDVIFLIDTDIYRCDKFGVHPNDNTATVILSPHEAGKIFDHLGAKYRFLEV
ncbi:MAG: prolyl-tRNA synthetase associated domain-containing protein [Peptococcaceae bacterium]|jgi:Ala-tRNA(Pro) deacylase|nr:prolyl-tRNA synthetase associated domain-containing protein [Peptococcaceae bacterium]